MSDRDDTGYVQGFLDRGELIPAGDYWCPGGVTIPAGYGAMAEAAGRPLRSGSYALTDGRVVLGFRDGGYGDLSTTGVAPDGGEVGIGRGAALSYVLPDGAGDSCTFTDCRAENLDG